MFLLLWHWSPKSDSDIAYEYLCHFCLVIFIHLYIYIYCFGLIFGGCPLVFLLFLRFTIIVCDKLLYQTISTIYISTKFKMDCGGIISEYSNILCWNRRLIWGIILVCQNHLNIINNDRNLLTSKVFSAFFFLFAHRVYTNAKNLPY